MKFYRHRKSRLPIVYGGIGIESRWTLRRLLRELRQELCFRLLETIESLDTIGNLTSPTQI
jgi:hypothetical protein